RETTGNYTIEYVYGTLKVLPREITVTTAGASRQYDGTPLTKREAGDYSAENLVVTEKHTHTLALDMSRESEFGTVTDVMDSPQKNTLFVLVKEGDKDVTSNYNIIEYVYGDLEVTPRDITVATASATKVYDGAPLVKEDGFTPSWLFTGHKLVLDESRRSEFGSVVNVAEGEVDNKLYFKVRLESDTEDNERVNANYNILPPETWGKLKVTARTITVTTEDKSWTYDGGEHEWDGKSCDEQQFLDKVIGDTKTKHVLVEDPSQGAFGKITNVWENEAENNVRYYVVYPEDHEENSAADNAFINQNYKIEYVYGDLVILERPVTITTISATKKYDGTELRGDRGYGENNKIEVGGEGIVSGEEAKAINDSVATIVDFGTIKNTTRYDIYKGDTLTTRNYKITHVDGDLEITQREITLTTLTAEKVYDGTPLDGDKGYGTNNKPIVTGDGLANGEKVDVIKSIGIVNVLWKDGEIDSMSNTTTYRILNRHGEESTHNYKIECEYGTLKILQREIKYTTPTATHEYDGEEFSKYDTRYTVDFVKGETTEAGKGLVLDHKLVPVTDMTNPYSTITNVLIENDAVTSIDNEVYYRVVDGNGDDITANYKITGRTWGKLTVTPRRLQITTNSHTWVYADSDFDDDGYTAKHFVKDSTTATDSAFTFVSGHALKTESKTTVHAVCTDTPNVCTYSVTDGTNDVSYNYELTLVNGKLTVSKRPITITSGSESWVYDGQAHNKLDGFTWTELG
ncbi:MAG: hypothetical protein K2J30_01720, partial [Clostridia bacterium]|nr:hypothetical protein [Clostridia bacterium]